jgi:NAD(P)-dependent dehydrogenase (short-subunit alcohol dehydrogenase family)
MGRAIGGCLVRRGYDVVFSARHSRAALERAAAYIDAHGGCSRVLEADLRDPGACRALVHEAAAWRNRLDLFVGLASIFERVAFEHLTPEIWRDQLAVDLDASFHCAQAVAGVMRQAGSGQIILSADWVAASGRPRYAGYVPYYVAKAGVVALTQALALELADAGIRVNAVAPGPIVPAKGTTVEQQAAVMAATPLRRWGTPDAVADAIGALVDTTFVTGEVIRVDGGRHLL